MNLPSPLLDDAVNELSRLPGIGKKTALRLVLHLLNKPEENSKHLGEALIRMREEIRFCKTCHNVSDSDTCEICANPSRDHSLICVVENLRDLISIENTNQFKGVYHILGGLISPIDGIGPDQLNFESLIERIDKGKVKELILALSPNIEGDTTMFYLSRQVKDKEVLMTSIARGVSFGGDLEYVDELTLSRSIASRIPFEQTIVEK